MTWGGRYTHVHHHPIWYTFLGSLSASSWMDASRTCCSRVGSGLLHLRAAAGSTSAKAFLYMQIGDNSESCSGGRKHLTLLMCRGRAVRRGGRHYGTGLHDIPLTFTNGALFNLKQKFPVKKTWTGRPWFPLLNPWRKNGFSDDGQLPKWP